MKNDDLNKKAEELMLKYWKSLRDESVGNLEGLAKACYDFSRHPSGKDDEDEYNPLFAAATELVSYGASLCICDEAIDKINRSRKRDRSVFEEL